jgi:hypothetical protein
MSNTCQAKNALARKNISGWDRAIADAKARIKKLEFSIRVFRQRKRNGEPWPGESAART